MLEKDWLLIDTLYVEKNITKTAQLLYVSQPALTYRIKQIEQSFGVPLIIRKKTGVEFTTEGEQIALYAKKMLLELQKLKDKLANTGDTVKGVLRLGVSSTFAQYKLPKLLKKFLELYPNVEINVKTGWSSATMQRIHQEEIHIGVVRGDIEWPEQKHLLQTEPISIVSKSSIDLDRLPSLPRILYKTDFHLSAQIENWWHTKYKSRPPLANMEVDNVQTCKELVKCGLGYAILPNISISNEKLFTYPITSPDGQVIHRDTWMICRDGLLELSAVRAFVDFAKEYFKDQIKLHSLSSDV